MYAVSEFDKIVTPTPILLAEPSNPRAIIFFILVEGTLCKSKGNSNKVQNIRLTNTFYEPCLQYILGGLISMERAKFDQWIRFKWAKGSGSALGAGLTSLGSPKAFHNFSVS